MPATTFGDQDDRRRAVIPPRVAALERFPGTPVPVGDQERYARIEKARRLMSEHGLGAIVLEPGTSLRYFVDVSWGTSERPFLLVIPAKGELAYVAPAFEEARAREITRFSNDVRVWQEDEDWGAVVSGILRDRGVATGTIGIEERVRFFIAEGLRAAAPASRFVLATAVTAGCRMIKSPAEIALMQRANDITIAAFRAAFASLAEGMTQFDMGNIVSAAFDALGVSGAAFAQFGAVLRLSTRQHHATTAEGRRCGAGGRGLHRRGLSIRHHAHDGLRHAIEAAG